jgi:hypothetical protein
MKIKIKHKNGYKNITHIATGGKSYVFPPYEVEETDLQYISKYFEKEPKSTGSKKKEE